MYTHSPYLLHLSQDKTLAVVICQRLARLNCVCPTQKIPSLPSRLSQNRSKVASSFPSGLQQCPGTFSVSTNFNPEWTFVEKQHCERNTSTLAKQYTGKDKCKCGRPPVRVVLYTSPRRPTLKNRPADTNFVQHCVHVAIRDSQRSDSDF